MAISDFPYTSWMLKDLAEHCDMVTLRYDVENGDGTVLDECSRLLKHMRKTYRVIPGTEKWNRWNWREQLLRSVDKVKPRLVLFPDHDEMFPSAWWDEELGAFEESHSLRAMFFYRMKTVDNRTVDEYPKARHCKAYKWREAMTYQPYAGYAIPNITGYDRFHANYPATSHMGHYCFYTRNMEKQKELHK